MKVKSKEDCVAIWGDFASKEARRNRFEQIYTLYVHEGLSLQQIAEKLNISRQRVHQLLSQGANDEELKEIKKRADILQRNTWRTKEIEHQLSTGLTCPEVARLLGISLNVVKRVSARYNKTKRLNIAVESK